MAFPDAQEIVPFLVCYGLQARVDIVKHVRNSRGWRDMEEHRIRNLCGGDFPKAASRFPCVGCIDTASCIFVRTDEIVYSLILYQMPWLGIPDMNRMHFRTSLPPRRPLRPSVQQHARNTENTVDISIS